MAPRGRGRGRAQGARQQHGGRGRGRAAAPDIPPGAYEVQIPVHGGGIRKKLMWRATAHAPLIMARNLRSIEGERWARRPSALIKAAGKRYASEWLIADEYDGCRDDFGTADMLPDEGMKEDVGWKPGPCVRELPAFRGPKPGPTPADINALSPPRDIMSYLLSGEFKFLTAKYTHAHIVAWRRDRDEAAGLPWGSIEMAFDRGDLSWLGWDPATGDYDQKKFENVFDLWVAAKLKVSQLKPEIPAEALWGKFSA